MKALTNIIGILLVLVGIISLGYHGFTYKKQEDVAKLGDLKITANKDETVFIPPAVGGVSLAAGIVLIVIGRLGKN